MPWNRLRRIALAAHELEKKRAAVQAHVSQLARDSDAAEPVIPASALAHWLGPFEHVFAPHRAL